MNFLDFSVFLNIAVIETVTIYIFSQVSELDRAFDGTGLPHYLHR